MKILWICFVWPEPTSSAAGFRSVQLIEVLRNAGHEVQVCSPCHPNKHLDKLKDEGIVASQQEANNSEFDTYIQSYQPQIVFFDRFMIEEQFSWRVKQHCPAALRILDTIDLHSLRRSRQRKVALNEDPLNLLTPDLHSEDAIREISSIYRCDLSLLVSEVELNLLTESYKIPQKLLTLCRFFYPTIKDVQNFDARKNFVAIGNFNHAPNMDSFKLLQESLWRKIREQFGHSDSYLPEIHIYGAYPSNEFLMFDNAALGFRVKGWTNNAQETLSNYRVNLAPLRFGAGIKGKISDGWAVGTPCVGTTLAAEGMHQGLDFGGSIADNWENFAEEAVGLYCNPATWLLAQQRGLKIIQELFNERTNSMQFISDIEQLVEEAGARREQNFIGKILWHQQFRSSEFFSRWIELKSKKLNPSQPN